jgi:hypothetical protein
MHTKDNLASHCYQKILCYHFLLTTCAGWTRIGSKPKRKRLKEGDDDRNIICVDALLPSPAHIKFCEPQTDISCINADYRRMTPREVPHMTRGAAWDHLQAMLGVDRLFV